MHLYKLKINSIILSLNSVLTTLPEYFIATSILSMAIFFSISQKLKIQNKKTNISFFLLNMTQLNYLAMLIIFFYCFLCFKQQFLYSFVSFNNTIHVDFIAIFAKLIIGISSFVYLLFIQQYLTDQKLNNFEYYIIILTAILGLCLLCCSDDLLTSYLAIELQGLSFYILASFKKTSNYSIESGVKYFILGSFSTVIFLLGINLIYGFSGSLSIIDFKDLFYWCSSPKDLSIFADNPNDFLFPFIVYHSVATAVAIEKFQYEDYLNYTIGQSKYEMFHDLFTLFSSDQALGLFRKEASSVVYCYRMLDYAIDQVLKPFQKAQMMDEIEQQFYRELQISSSENKPFLKGEFSDYMEKMSIQVDQELNPSPCAMKARIEARDDLLKTFFLMPPKDSPKIETCKETGFIQIGLFIILISLFFKLALSPFHVWSPDIYEGSPSSTTFFFTVISKLSIFVFLLKICYISFYYFIFDWQIYLLFVSVISVLVGSIGGLKQRKVKSLLAYSSISNMGLILISFSAGNFEGIKATFYYFIIYILSGLAIWSIFLILRLKRKDSIEKHNKDLGDFSLLKESNVVLSYAAVITLFTIAGIPPTVGFLAKIYIFLSLTTASFYFVALIAIVSTVISTFYYIRILKTIFFENLLVGKLFHPINSKSIIVCNILFLSLIFLFISPEFISFYSYKTILYLNKTFY